VGAIGDGDASCNEDKEEVGTMFGELCQVRVFLYEDHIKKYSVDRGCRGG